jgi:YD repeat-containing protein
LTNGCSWCCLPGVWPAPDSNGIIDDGNPAAHLTYLYTGRLTSFVLIDQVIYQRDALGHATNVFRLDPATQEARTIYKADWKGTNTWPGDLNLSETDYAGTTNLYAYDSLKRVKTRTKQDASVTGYPTQSAVVQSLSYDAAGRVLTNTVSAGLLSLNTISS